MTNRPYVIFDIDGTLADNDHRRHYVENRPKNWKAFFSEMHKDTPKRMVRDLNWWLTKSGYGIILVTARFDEYRQVTKDWLHANLIHYDSLYMRSDKDFRPDTEVKKEIYEQKLRPFFDVRLVVDDREPVVRMWRSLGLECWQVAAGEF